MGSWLTACSVLTGCCDGEVGQRPRLDHREHQRSGAHLQVPRHLAQVRVADDHVQPPVLVGAGVRFVAGVDDRALEGGLQPDLDLEEVGALRHLEAGDVARLPEPDPAGPGDDLAAHEERDQPADDLRERRRPVHQVVLVRPVRGALVVGGVLVEVDRRLPGHLGEAADGRQHHQLAGLVPPHGVQRARHLRAGVLGVRVVDVETGAVGEHDVRQRRVVELVRELSAGGVGELARVRLLPPELPAPRVAQRLLVLVVPAGAARPRPQWRRVRVDHLARQQHRVRGGIARGRDAVLGLDPHHPAHGHAASLRNGARSGRAAVRAQSRQYVVVIRTISASACCRYVVGSARTSSIVQSWKNPVM